MFDASSKIHEAVEQLSRQKSALRLNVENINHDEKTGVINGYNVTLEECSCRDWFIRRLPCKHMYRLAHELGIFELKGNVKNDKNAKSDAALRAERALLKEKAQALPPDAQYVLWQLTSGKMLLEKTPENEKIIDLLMQGAFVDFREPSTDEIYKDCKMKQMREYAPDAPKFRKYDDLAAWLRENHPEFEENLKAEFNKKYYILKWPEKYKEFRIAVQRAITPYKGLNAMHCTTISIDLDAGNIEIKRIK